MWLSHTQSWSAMVFFLRLMRAVDLIYRPTVFRISLFVMSVFYVIPVKSCWVANVVQTLCPHQACSSIASVTTKQCDSIPLSSSVCCSINHSSLVQHVNAATAKSSRSFSKTSFQSLCSSEKRIAGQWEVAGIYQIQRLTSFDSQHYSGRWVL